MATEQTGVLEGRVTVAEGSEALPGVTVTAEDLDTELRQDMVTDDNGAYEFSALPPSDHYRVTFELEGFLTDAKENVSVNEGQATTVNATMQISGVEEEGGVSMTKE